MTVILPASNDTDINGSEVNDSTVSDSEQDASFVDTPTDNSPEEPINDGYVDVPTEE